ncbi:MAG: hypothetical protein WCL24_00785 [Verrucomicrobiota bacterium]
MKQLHAAAAGVTAPALGRDPASMSAPLLQSLQAMRPKIRARWEALLRIERLHTPLANPDTLVFMFDLTLDEVLAALPGRAVHSPGPRPTCRNHHNPMRDYFPALEQALLEALILAQAAEPVPKSRPHSETVAERVAAVTELCFTLRLIARRETAAFDQMCRQPTRPRQPRAGAPTRRRAPHGSN